jgi:hypothetical protein
MNDLLHIVKDDSPQYGHQQQHGRQHRPQQRMSYQQQQQPYEQHYEQQYHDQNNDGQGYGRDVEEGRNGYDSPTHGVSDDMQQFFAKTKDVQMHMSEIRHRQHELWQMHEQSKTLVRRQEITPHRERMQVRWANIGCADALGNGLPFAFRTVALLKVQPASASVCWSSRVSTATTCACHPGLVLR